MSGIGAAIIGGSAITGLLSANAQSDAAKQAAAAQMQANQQALQAQQQNYRQGVNYQDKSLAAGNTLAGNQQSQLSGLFAPYVQAGQNAIPGLQQYAQGGLNAFNQQQNFTGANGADAQSQAINGLQNSPMFQQLAQQGNQAILQNASATGGIRGGNTQAALAQFSPQLLNQLLQQQFQNLGSLSSLGSQSQNTLAGLGQGSAAAQAQGGINILGQQLGLAGQTAGNVAQLSGANTSAITGLTNQQGAIGAGLANAQGLAQQNLFGGIGSAINRTALLNSGFFGGSNNASAGGGSFLPSVASSMGPGEGQSLLGNIGGSY